MERFLDENGFAVSDIPNEYVKGNWTIRIDDDLVEVFNNPEVERGVYYSGLLSVVDIKSIVDEIANFNYDIKL